MMDDRDARLNQIDMPRLRRNFRRLLAVMVLLVAGGVATQGEYPLAGLFATMAGALWWRSYYP